MSWRGGLAALLVAAAPAAAATAGDAGERAFQKCYACHSVDPAEAAATLPGPHLGGVLDRPAAALPDFPYSEPMRAAGAGGLVWTAAALDAFIADPEAFLPGTDMAFVGMPDAQERAALIDYLKKAE